MKLKPFKHGTAMEHTFTITLRGEIVGQPVGWGTEAHEEAHLMNTLRDAVRDAVARYYQCRIHGASLQVTFPAAPSQILKS